MLSSASARQSYGNPSDRNILMPLTLRTVGRRKLKAAKFMIDCLEQWMFPATTSVHEVIQVKSPDHSSTKIHSFDVL
jgi:hypothetical protein